MFTNTSRQQQLEQEVRELKENQRALAPQDSPTVQFERTAHGFMAHVIPPEPSSAPASSSVIAGQLGLVPRGEWHSSLQINALDMFIVYSGANAGVYYATEAQNPGGPEPGTGGFYVKMGNITESGLWI